MIDQIGRAGTPQQLADSKAMHHPPRAVQSADARAGQGQAVITQIMKSALRVGRGELEKVELLFRLRKQPAAMEFGLAPERG